MNKSIFDPNTHQDQLSTKIIVGLERISEAFKVLLWEKAKVLGLSPIQIQILIFIAYHKPELCNVSHLAQEFNLTKPTISDAIRVLNNKACIVKDFSSSDNRSYTILLSHKGQKIVEETENFAEPIKRQLDKTNDISLNTLYTSLNKLIYQLNQIGILTVQRTCYGCKFYDQTSQKHYCNLLNQELVDHDIRLDCPEFQEKSVE